MKTIMGKIDFDNVPKNSFDPVPEDRYNLECVEAKLAESQKGNPKISTQFKIIGGDYDNRRIFNDFSLVQAAWFNLRDYFEAAGIDVSGEIDFEDLPKMMLNTQVSAFVKIQANEYKGEIRQRNVPIQWKSVGAGEQTLFE